MMDRVCIIGGGASALMCACFAKGDVTIFEKAEKCGKKILATGNGRCNLTNKNMYNCSYNVDVSEYLKMFNVEQSLSFFESIGLETYFDEEGRCYPVSNTATSVLSTLRNYIKTKKNIEIYSEKNVNNINFYNNIYQIEFDNGEFAEFDKVVIATGKDTDLTIFDKFNVKYKEFTPSLCSLKTIKHKNLSGIRVSNVKVICNELNFEENGEILFKDNGISGIVIFNLSAHMARLNNYCHSIYIDILPNVDLETLKKKLIHRKDKLIYYNADNFLTGFFHKELNYEILKRCNIKLDTPVLDFTDKNLNAICSQIKKFKLETLGVFDNNQVCSGGIDLTELNENLECKSHKGLYFIGEVCDVDGVCGGYNLQWAWTSGKIVGENL